MAQQISLPPISLEILSNPLLVAIISAVVTLFLRILHENISRQRKELSYSIITDTTLVRINKDDYKDKIKITFDGVPVKTLQVISLKLINTGNVIIDDASDYDMPITFVDDKAINKKDEAGFFLVKFPDNSDISKRAQAKVYRARIGIKPLYFNKGESLRIDTYNIDVYDNKVKIDVQGRLKGGKIKELKKAKYLSLVRSIYIHNFNS